MEENKENTSYVLIVVTGAAAEARVHVREEDRESVLRTLLEVASRLCKKQITQEQGWEATHE